MFCHLFKYLVPPPRIIQDPMDTTDPVTQAAMFVCVGQGYGFVNVSWIRAKDKPLREKSIVTTMVTPDNITTITSNLTIRDLKDSDGGKYRCIYNTSAGEIHSRLARLTIGSKCLHIMIILLYKSCSSCS